MLAAALGCVRYWPRAPLAAHASTSVAVYDAHGKLLRLTLAADEKYRLWTPLQAIAPELIAAFLLHEDQHFYRHPGANPVALVRGVFRTYVAKQPPQGGSTITMQLARLMYRLNTRTFTGKLAQIARALQLEATYGKREILEAYLNLVPFGANIEGVGAASVIYFGKPPKSLALPESLTLAVVPQAPLKRMLARADERNLLAVRERLAARWQAERGLSAEEAAMLTLPLDLRSPTELAFRAPHAATMLVQQRRRNESTTIRSTIDLRLQSTLERVARGYVSRQRRIGVQNVAAMLVDYRTMEVKAVLGSADFKDPTIDGQVNGTLAKRSPGSTVKPFIYALAIDQGHIHPLTVLKDAPTAFGPFSPENFDGAFAGPLAAKDALVRSRNVPAVALAAKLANPSLYQFLRSAGVSRLASERNYGLALALGGAEMSMEELAALYAMLGNGGLWQPLRYRSTDATATDGLRVLSAEASFITLDMLRDNPRPEGTMTGARAGLPVAWKTGTSWGFRDAWSVGLFGPYVLAVWVGNFDGSSNPAFVGGKSAAPLFFQIVDAVSAAEPGLAEPARRTPANLLRVEVCAASGDLPNAHCPRTASTWFIPGRSPIRVSDVHREVAIDTRTGAIACPETDAKFVRREVFEFWPSDVHRVFAQAGMPRRQPPAAANCADVLVASGGPAIASPLRGTAYAMRAPRAEPERVPLMANADGEARTLFWFVNDSFVGAAAPGASLGWTPRGPGAYTVRVVDEHGRADARELRVVAVP
jgi:penicillin-binding protein 1C